MKLLYLVLVFVTSSFLCGCRLFRGGTDSSEVTANKPMAVNSDLSRLLNDYHEERLKWFPLDATYSGDPRYNDRFVNLLTDANRDGLARFYRDQLKKLAPFKRSSLLPEERISVEVLEWDLETNLRQLEFPTFLMPINQFESLHLTMGQLAGGSAAQPFKSVQDYEAWIKRVESFIEWCDSAESRMREGVRRGHVLPKSLIVKVIPQLADLAKSNVEEHLYYGPIKQMPESISGNDRIRLSNIYAQVIREKLVPTFRRLHEFVSGEYLRGGRASSGISGVPGGRDYYEHQIKIYTTTELSAETIHQLGLTEVKRIMNEMEVVKKQVRFQGDMKAFFDHVRTKKELMPFTDPQQVIDNFKAIHRKMMPAVDRLFRLQPKTAFEIRRTESFREASASAEYMQGSLDGTRPGIFYVPIPNVKEYNLFSDEDLFLHEAIPGHHYQVSLQQENSKLPTFRRTIWYGAYGEGWALYCESLGKELGLYDDPYQYFGMLSAEMHRAIRLVVDTGIHVKGWSREQAIQYSLEHEAESEGSIVAEIERYMAWPGQALSYKVGQMKILELRKRAEQRLGNKFDIRSFHEQVLESGCLPLKILETKVDRWVQSVLYTRN